VEGTASALWERFLGSDSPAARDARGASYETWQFGYGVEQGDRLLALVLSRRKVGTAGALWAYEHDGEPVPSPGDFSVVTDGSGVARCVIRTTVVRVIPFDDVDAEHAAAEGEGDLSLTYWRDVHWRFFARELAGMGMAATHDMPVVCERFELVFIDGDEA
jgi:histidinol-phosphate aminotransferase